MGIYTINNKNMKETPENLEQLFDTDHHEWAKVMRTQFPGRRLDEGGVWKVVTTYDGFTIEQGGGFVSEQDATAYMALWAEKFPVGRYAVRQERPGDYQGGEWKKKDVTPQS